MDFLYLPNFIENHSALFETLRVSVEWDERMKSRKTASFGTAYNYSQITYEDKLFPDTLDEVRVKLEGKLRFPINNCLLNYYLDGNSSMWFHSDTATGRTAETGVAIISLGAEREMAFKKKGDTQNTSTRILEAGSLLYLDDLTQEKWMHAIPRSQFSGPRISLSFRSIQEPV